MKPIFFAILLTAVLSFTTVSYAAGGGGTGGTGGTGITASPSSYELSDIADPIIRIFNILVLAGGLVFIMMIFYSAYKYSLAQGDPKGIVGAKETLNYAIYGFIVTVGAFAIIKIIAGIFHLDTAIIEDPGGASKSGIQQFMDFMKL